MVNRIIEQVHYCRLIDMYEKNNLLYKERRVGQWLSHEFWELDIGGSNPPSPNRYKTAASRRRWGTAGLHAVFVVSGFYFKLLCQSIKFDAFYLPTFKFSIFFIISSE